MNGTCAKGVVDPTISTHLQAMCQRQTRKTRTLTEPQTQGQCSSVCWGEWIIIFGFLSSFLAVNMPLPIGTERLLVLARTCETAPRMSVGEEHLPSISNPPAYSAVLYKHIGDASPTLHV